MTIAQDFEQFMIRVWEDTCVPHPDGSLTIIPSPEYDEWHDANKTALYKFNGGMVAPTTRDGNRAYIRRFPDGSRVVVWKDGTGFAQANPPRGKNN